MLLGLTVQVGPATHAFRSPPLGEQEMAMAVRPVLSSLGAALERVAISNEVGRNVAEDVVDVDNAYRLAVLD